jgi:parallel beta-helix repeat protein
VLEALGGVVVDGSDDYSSPTLWVPYSDAIYLAPSVSWNPMQVFMDGARLTPSLDAPGSLLEESFTWVSGEGLYVNAGGSEPGDHELLVGRRNYGFNMFTKSWITIEGFGIAHTESRGIFLNSGCSDIVVSRDTVSFANSYGIQAVNGLRIVVEACRSSDNNFHGIGLTAGSTACTLRTNESFRNADPNTRRANGIHLFSAPGNILYGNRVYDNQDSGLHFGDGANDCLAYNNRSWNNGDHGYDHLDVVGTTHVHNVAYGNNKDGFSIEGDSPGSRIYNCIAVDNGLTTDRFNLWVNAPSAVGFTSGYNILWNSTPQEPVKFMTTKYDLLSDYVADSGQDAHSLQADPMFANARGGDFMPLKGSPAIDAGNSGAPGWPASDFMGNPRFDDPTTPDAGAGPVTFADIGAVEYVDTSNDDIIKLPTPWRPRGERRAGVNGNQVSGSEERLALSTGFPNPSRGPVEFALDLPREAQVEWTVYDLQGRAVWSEGRTVAAGRTQLRWDGTASTGDLAATGIYLVRARVDGTQFTRRVIRF